MFLMSLIVFDLLYVIVTLSPHYLLYKKRDSLIMNRKILIATNTELIIAAIYGFNSDFT